MECKGILINKDLYEYLGFYADICNTSKWINKTTNTNIQNDIYRVNLKFDNYDYLLKVGNITNLVNEKNTLKILADKMFHSDCPKLYPFMYISFTTENNLNILFQNATETLASVMNKNHSIEWWNVVLYQITKGINYLESLKIKHNNLTCKNIVFQKYSMDPTKVAIMFINFEKSKQNFVSQNFRNTDLYNFLLDLNTNYSKNTPTEILNLINTGIPSVILSRQIILYDPKVSYYNTPERQSKLIGLLLGSLIGDAAGMPVLFDKSNKQIFGLQEPKLYDGYYKLSNFNRGTFTTATRMLLTLLYSLNETKNSIIFNRIDVNKIYKSFKDNYIYTKNYYYTDYARQVFETDKVLDIEDYTCLMYSPLIVVFDNTMDLNHIINDTIKVCKIMTLNKKTIDTAVVINLILYKLINETNNLKEAVEKSLEQINKKSIEKSIDNDNLPEILNILTKLYDFKSYEKAINYVINLKGNSTLNAAVIGSIIGVIYQIPQQWLNVLGEININNSYNGVQINLDYYVNLIYNLIRF
jgi:ADP-ribosylglycohydrolase